MISAGKLSIRARRIITPLLVTPVSTIILVITLPGGEDAATILAPELVRLAGVVGAIVLILVTVVATVV